MSFSNALPIVDKRLIEEQFGGNFECQLGFGRVMIFASFHGAGK
jgi:hypothetical protein